MSQKNNHGTWSDMQVAALAPFLGDKAVARSVIGTSAKQRVDSQIARDGSQPLELARTRPLHYSLFNLDAFTQLAEMARNVGIDLWNYTSPSGGSLPNALRFVAPYSYTNLKFKKSDFAPVTADDVVLPFRRAAAIFADTTFSHAEERADRPPEAPRWWRLFYPGVSAASVSDRRRLFDDVLTIAQSKLRSSALQLDPKNGYPRFTKPGG